MKDRLRAVAGLAIGGLLVWLLFRNTDWGEVRAAMSRASVPWLLVSILLIVLSSFLRTQRWTYIVRTAQPVRYRHMFSATQIGLLANLLLPARLGDVVQAAVLSRLAHVPFSKSISMTALDRVLDLISLLVVILISIGVFEPVDCLIPKETFGWPITFSASQMVKVERGVGLMLVVVIAAFVLLYARQAQVLKVLDLSLGWLSRGIAERAQRFALDFLHGFRIFRNAMDMAKAVAYSLITWTVSILAMAAMIQAFHISGPWYSSTVVVMLLAIGISMPAAPGLIGQFQVPVVVALLMLTSADDGTAKALSIVGYVIDVVLIVIIGLLCIYIEKLNMSILIPSDIMVKKRFLFLPSRDDNSET